jgi:hypothetical protein
VVHLRVAIVRGYGGDLTCPGMVVDATARARLVVQGVLHTTEMDRFVTLCIATPTEELAGLRLQVQAHLARVREEAESSSVIDLATATRIAIALGQVLDEPDQYGPDERALLRGAVDYFVQRDDERDDLDHALGFDDDARVVNAVLDALGRADLHIRAD